MRAKWRSSSSARSSALKKCLTRADIVREACLQQLLRMTRGSCWNESQDEANIGSYRRREWFANLRICGRLRIMFNGNRPCTGECVQSTAVPLASQ
jgi:hypothetical protein